MTTIELFTTTIDAVGMEVSPAEGGPGTLPFLLGCAVVLVFLAFAFDALRSALAGRWSDAREHADVVVVSGIVSALLCFPLTTDAFSAYGKIRCCCAWFLCPPTPIKTIPALTTTLWLLLSMISFRTNWITAARD